MRGRHKRSRVDDLTYAESDDESSEEDVKPNIADIRSCQIQTQTSTSAATNLPLAGTLKCLNLKNFMNHRHLEVQFGDKINFIVGKNGSGKSAIVTGLLICLGARASITQRGLNVKTLIRKGEQQAIVRVEIWNSGSGGYQYESFGDTIAIERRITQTTSTYKIMNSSGHVKGHTHKLLVRILENFDINLDNPTTVLTQDMSREFLASADPRKLYAFFKQATRLDTMENDLSEVNHNIENANVNLKRREKAMDNLHKEVQKVQERVNACESKVRLTEKIKALKRDVHLIDRANVQAEISDFQAQKVFAETELDKRSRNMENIRSNLETLKAEEHRLRTANTELIEQKKLLQNKKERIDENAKRTKTDVTSISMLIQNKNAEIDKREKEISSLEAKADEIRTRNREAVDQQREDLKVRMDKLDTDLRELNLKKGAIDALQQQLRDSTDKLQSEMNQLKANEARFMNDIERCNRQIHEAKMSKGNSLRVFGQKTPEILKMIANCKNTFKHPPLGPMGSLIKSVDPKYDLAIEKTLKPAIMCGYLCDNNQDASILREIFRNVFGPNQKFLPTIITQNFQNEVYDTSSFKAVSGNPTLQDVITCDAVPVFNAIIDQVEIETVLVFGTLASARNALIMSTPPRNCKKGICFDGGEVFPKKAVYPSKEGSTCKFLNREDENTRIQKFTEICEKIDVDLKENGRNMKERRTVLASNRNELDKQGREVQKVSNTISNIRRKKTDLARQLDELVSDETIEVFEAEIVTLKCQVEAIKQKLTESEDALSSKRQDLCEYTKDYKSIGEAIRLKSQEISDDIPRFTEVLNAIKVKESFLGQSVGKAEVLNSRIIDFVEKIHRFTVEMDEIDRRLTSSGYDPEQKLENRRKKADVEKLIVEFEKTLALRNQEVPENREELEVILTNKKTAVLACKAELDSSKDLIKMLESVCVLRQEHMVKLRDVSSVKMASGFKHKMTLRNNGYSGSLLFDHEHAKLNIQISTEEAASSSPAGSASGSSGSGATVRSNAQLSGGERSFTTVCFITALWSAVADSSPFKVLDEFDVFMDMINRRLSMDFLLSFASQQHQPLPASGDPSQAQGQSQFIFLTPLDLSKLDPDPSRKIHKMPEPDRRTQTQLDSFYQT